MDSLAGELVAVAVAFDGVACAACFGFLGEATTTVAVSARRSERREGRMVGGWRSMSICRPWDQKAGGRSRDLGLQGRFRFL